ncbi:MAG: hypothetical protein M5U13_10600 [Thermoanaerobaculia bacterium]|nr:hypothetical protein [Thermoanaerobaculia bacterium]
MNRSLVGFSPLPVDAITGRAAAGDSWGALPGDFVAVRQEGETTTVTSSVVAVSPYYYSLTPEGAFVHGPDFFDVFFRSGHDWEWHEGAVSSLALLGHLLGEDTLHPRIHRVPAGSQLTFREGRLERSESAFLARLVRDPRADRGDEGADERALDALETAFSDLPSGQPVLSLSAGIDSRLLMALCLHAGVAPRAITMGSENATDVLVAARLARLVGWEWGRIALEKDDYWPNRLEIVRATGGVKTAANWHTYLYTKKAGIGGNTPHLVGANGEFCRTHYFHANPHVHVLRHGRPWLLEPYLFLRAVRRRLKFRAGWRVLARRGAFVAAIWSRFRGIAAPFRDARNTLLAADAVHLTHRVRHFIGAGIASYRASSLPVSPFLDARWLEAAVFLDRRQKLIGDLWQPAAVRHFAPLLDDLPYNREPAQDRPVSYNIFPAVCADPALKAELVERVGELEGLLDPAAAKAAIRNESREDVALIMPLLTVLDILGEGPKDLVDAQKGAT